MMLPGEKGAVRLALTLAERYGYGNLIAWLKAGWAEKLMKDGVSQQGAMEAGRVTGYPISYLEQIRPPGWGSDHVTTGDECWCSPDTEVLENGDLLVIHKCKSEAN